MIGFAAPPTVTDRVREIRRIAIFGTVGCIAFGVHFGVVVALVTENLAPLLANVFGFLCAFGVSFLGHHRFTFPESRGRNRIRALHRFLRVAVLGFVANEALFWVLLRTTQLPYQLILLTVLATVAAMTLLLSKYWAFADD
jgi:putative flippase GtrA